jgi:hypothetical protein
VLARGQQLRPRQVRVEVLLRRLQAAYLGSILCNHFRQFSAESRFCITINFIYKTVSPGANTLTCEFTTMYNTSVVVGKSVFTKERKKFCF